MKRFVLSTLVIFVSFYVTTWIFDRYSLPIVVPHSDGYYLSNCAWFSSLNGSRGSILNLSLFSGVDIFGKIQNGFDHREYFNFLYSPCSNDAKCSNSDNVMIQIYNDSYETQTIADTMCLPLMRWDGGATDPFHSAAWHTDPEYAEFWAWNYSNSSLYTYNSDRVMLYWVCDPFLPNGAWRTRPNTSWYYYSSYYNRTDFTFTIFSAAACNETNNTNITTTTTQVPGGECFWNIGNNMLNLTAFKNQTLVTIDGNNNSLVVAISPCDNLLMCNNEKVMSYRVDYLHNSDCVDYLAIWENGFVEPRYDHSKKAWQFIYENGAKCGSFERIFEVYWQCDYQRMNSAEIITFLQTGTCSFEMHINSSYACA